MSTVLFLNATCLPDIPIKQNKYKNMKKDYFLQFSNNRSAQYTLPQHPALSATLPQPESVAKKMSLQMHNNPMGHQKPFLLSSAKNPENLLLEKGKQISNESSTSSLSQGVRDRVKSSSFTMEVGQPKNKSKYDYLFYKQEQHRLEQAAENEIRERSGARGREGVEEENHLLREQNRLLKAKMEKIEVEFARREEAINRREGEVGRREEAVGRRQGEVGRRQGQAGGLSHVVQQLRGQLSRREGLQREYKSLLANYNFMVTKWQGYQQSEDYYAGIGEKYREMVERCAKLESILQQKDATMQNSIRGKNEEYTAVVQAREKEVRSLEMRISILEKENQRLESELQRVASQYQYTTTESQKKGDGQGKFQTQKFIEAAGEFQEKIGAAWEQNNRLKNTINHLQGKIQELRVQKESLQKTLTAFEERDRTTKSSRLASQLELLREQLESSKEEHDRTVSKYELQILKLQNLVQAKRFQATGSLLDFYDEERLHQGFLNALAEIDRLKSRLQAKR